ncbi:MAG: cobyrinate a,c-diamide synthase [Pseudomonadota bacterium]
MPKEPCPRLVLAGLRGGSGKTTVSLGLTAAWRQAGRDVVPFKKGPDYIDAGWLALAAGRPCYNLDPFLMSWEGVLYSFARRAAPRGINIVEGNRGLYDGLDARGEYSTAELAKRLRAPLVLVVDCTKATRTVAALVLGCKCFDDSLNLAGVVLNRIAGSRHEAVVRASLAEYCGVPVVGALPKLSARIAERHMGLVPSHEVAEAGAALDFAAECARKYLDLDALEVLAQAAPPIEWEAATVECRPVADRPRIGVIRDEAFWFYYPENLEALAEAGAEVVWLDALRDGVLPPLDGLYIGGGFPEVHAERLAANSGFRESLRLAIEDWLPVYAECGGLMYLGRDIRVKDTAYPMVGVFLVSFGLEPKPQGHGYTVLEVEEQNPFYPPGRVVRGHEFRYSRVLDYGGGLKLAFRLERGHGFQDGRDGLIYKNVLAGYTHVHALGTKEWAFSLVDRAAEHRGRRMAETAALAVGCPRADKA